MPDFCKSLRHMHFYRAYLAYYNQDKLFKNASQNKWDVATRLKKEHQMLRQLCKCHLVISRKNELKMVQTDTTGLLSPTPFKSN